MYHNNLFKGVFVAILLLVMAFSSNNGLFSQTARNPVLEYCSGTW
jgi:hypothetical protein